MDTIDRNNLEGTEEKFEKVHGVSLSFFFTGVMQEMSLKPVLNGLGLGHKLGEYKLKFQPAKF